jgi:hypothetical protein
MATALIQLTTAGADTDNFTLYSDATGYGPYFESGISRASLLAGYTSNLVPAGTTTIRVKSNSVCSNYVDIAVGGLTTTTTTTTSTTTTTTTIAPNSVIYNELLNDITLQFNLYGKVGSGGTYQLIYAEPSVITILSGDYYEFYQTAYPGAFASTSNVYFRIDILAGSIGIQGKSFPTAPSDTKFYLDKSTGSGLGVTTLKYFSLSSPALTISTDSWSGGAPNAVFGISIHIANSLL